MPPSPTARQHELDALRGVAAVSVVAYHAFSLVTPSREILWAMFCSPAFLLVTGRPMVILFFVLSGFVLHSALSNEMERRGRIDLGAFAVKRFCRIYLPFTAAACLALAVAFIAANFGTLSPEGTPKPITGWPDASFFSADAFARYLTLSGIERDMGLNSVAWTLVYELRISLALPFLWLLMRRRGPATLAIAAGLACVACVWLEGPSAVSSPATLAEANFQSFGTLAASLAATLYYLPMFLAGSLAAEMLSRSSLGLDALGGARTAALVAFACFMLWYPNDLVVTAGAALLVMLTARAPACQAVARRRLPAFLGRISYSLYLIHLPLLYCGVLTLGGALGVPGAVMVSLAAMPAAAAVFAALVERPAQRLGRRLTARPAGAAAPALATQPAD